MALFGILLAFATGTAISRLEEQAQVRAAQQAADDLPPPYRERDVSFPSGEVTIAGTLTLPQGEGPFPAVIFISGAGAQDRDSEFFGHRRGKIKADALARAGIAVLRTDDRGTGGSTGDTPSAALNDLAGDAWAAVSFLQTQPEIDPDRIGLKGSSLGSAVAPLVVAEHPEIAFVVLISAIGVPGRQLWVQQQVELATKMGMPADEATKAEVLLTEILATLDADLAEEERAGRLRKSAYRLDGLMPSTDFTGVASSMEVRLATLLAPTFQEALNHDPRPALERLRVPTLVIHGDRDFQVDAETNLAAIREALDIAGNPDVEIHLLPGLNHFLQPAETGLPSEYPTIEVAIAPEVLELLATWIGERFG